MEKPREGISNSEYQVYANELKEWHSRGLDVASQRVDEIARKLKVQVDQGAKWEEMSDPEIRYSPHVFADYSQFFNERPTGIEGHAYFKNGQEDAADKMWHKYASPMVRIMFGGTGDLITGYAPASELSDEELRAGFEARQAEQELAHIAEEYRRKRFDLDIPEARAMRDSLREKITSVSALRMQKRHATAKRRLDAWGLNTEAVRTATAELFGELNQRSESNDEKRALNAFCKIITDTWGYMIAEEALGDAGWTVRYTDVGIAASHPDYPGIEMNYHFSMRFVWAEKDGVKVAERQF